MTRGDMHTGTNTVTITSDRAGNGIILGTITRTHTFLSGTPYAFEGPFNTINFTSGSAVSSVADLGAALTSHRPGDRVRVGWTDSSGAPHNATVTLAAGPPA